MRNEVKSMLFGIDAKPTAGQLTLDGQELRPLTFIERRYYRPCCEKALVLTPSTCVCAFQTSCPEHGLRHNGTHD